MESLIKEIYPISSSYSVCSEQISKKDNSNLNNKNRVSLNENENLKRCAKNHNSDLYYSLVGDVKIIVIH